MAHLVSKSRDDSSARKTVVRQPSYEQLVKHMLVLLVFVLLYLFVTSYCVVNCFSNWLNTKEANW